MICFSSNAVAIAAGLEHTCVLQANGTGRCWGGNAVGQLGIGTTGGSRLTSVAVSSALGSAVAISAGSQHTCALLANGSAMCWGSDSVGQIGDGTFVIDGTAETPISILAGTGTFTARDVVAGRSHTCAVRANGNVACWGANDSGQLGAGDMTGGATLRLVSAGWSFVAAGENHTCAVTSTDGTLFCFGAGAMGRLGTGGMGDELSPVMIPIP